MVHRLRQPGPVHLERGVCHPQLRVAAVEGGPGSGKTVLLEHLAAVLAPAHLGSPWRRALRMNSRCCAARTNDPAAHRFARDTPLWWFRWNCRPRCWLMGGGNPRPEWPTHAARDVTLWGMSFEVDEPVEIDPRVDVVFHKLFGDPAHPQILLAFLNAVLAPPVPFVEVEILNPFSPGLYQGDRRVVFDVRARTADGRIVQVEMQRRRHVRLPARMLFGWATALAVNSIPSDDFSRLAPVSAIWICEPDPFPHAGSPHLIFEMRERAAGLLMHDHCRIDVLRLSQWATHRDELLRGPLGPWFWFFNEASQWRRVPPTIKLDVLGEALATMYDFRKDVQLEELYRARLKAERIDRQQEEALEQALAKAQAEAAAREDAESALADAERHRDQEAAARQRAETRIRELEAKLAELTQDQRSSKP